MKSEEIIQGFREFLSDCDAVESSGVRCREDFVMHPNAWCDACRVQWLLEERGKVSQGDLREGWALLVDLGLELSASGRVTGNNLLRLEKFLAEHRP